VSKGKYREYESVVDLSFEHLAGKYMHFKAVVFDRCDPAYRAYRGDREVGFYKLYYQFFGPQVCAVR
jgi:hypothetical protein